jgi:hypothetical protein
MIDELTDALLACSSKRQLAQVHSRAEAVFTPLEFVALSERSQRFPSYSQSWLKMLADYGGFGAAPTQRFCREPVASSIDLYRDASVPSDRKRLILAFCGAADRLMMPIPCVLQSLPSDLCDVAILHDCSREHYTSGIPPYASSFVELVMKLIADLAVDRYGDVCCYGTSMGGFVALRCGVLIGSAAISVGGRFIWHPTRLLEGGSAVLPAFDILCDCNASTPVSLIACYNAAVETDKKDAELLARIVPTRLIPIAVGSTHNVIVELWKQGQLDGFYNRLFGFPEQMEAAQPRRGTLPSL